jgi:hypothetical protein
MNGRGRSDEDSSEELQRERARPLSKEIANLTAPIQWDVEYEPSLVRSRWFTFENADWASGWLEAFCDDPNASGPVSRRYAGPQRFCPSSHD